MGFSAKQLQALRRPPGRSHIRTREANGRELSYLEGWYAISEANRIFGFDGWSRETLESRCVLARETRGTFLAVYLARVRVTVQADGATIIREGHGTGEGRGTSPGEVHDIALKAAETDATKRALAKFGKPFGLELYRGGKTAAPQKPLPAPPVLASGDARVGFRPDDTTPIPRPSRYYGRRQNVLWRLRRATGIETALFEAVIAELGEHEHSYSGPTLFAGADLSKRSQSDIAAESSINYDAQKGIKDAFFRLTALPTFPLDRLSRYEYLLWRQARQLVFTLNFLRRRTRQPRRATSPFSFCRRDRDTFSE